MVQGKSLTKAVRQLMGLDEGIVDVPEELVGIAKQPRGAGRCMGL